MCKDKNKRQKPRGGNLGFSAEKLDWRAVEFVFAHFALSVQRQIPGLPRFHPPTLLSSPGKKVKVGVSGGS